MFVTASLAPFSWRLDPDMSTRLLVRLASILLLGVVAPLCAQGVTGVPGLTDYTINGLGSGTSSCNFQLLTAGPNTFSVNTLPGTTVIFLFNLNCPCMPCFMNFPGGAACPVPPTVCSGFTTNQSLDLNIGFVPCVLLSGSLVAGATGQASLTLGLPSGIRFSTQAMALLPCSVLAPFPPMFTQAHNVSVL